MKPKPSADLTALHATLGTTVLRSFPAIGNLQIVQLAPGASVTNELAEFQQSGLVQYAEPDWVVHAQLAPNDNFYQQAYLWNFNNIGLSGGTAGADIRAPAAWDIQNTAPGIIVAVTDIGARLTHEDLAPNLWTNPGEIAGNGIDDDGNGYVDDVHGINAISNTGDPNNTDSTGLNGHGSHVSGIIGAKGSNIVGVVGVCWQVQLMECRFLETNATGYVSDAIKCIDYARTNGAKIINASWGDYISPNPAGEDNGILDLNASNSASLHQAIASAQAAGIIFVAACGNSHTDNDKNDSSNAPLYPASYTDLDNIIAVAATDSSDQLASFSNYGATTVHLGAPGVEVLSCWNGSDTNYQHLSGTSMATPHVAGACALVWAHYPGDNYQTIIKRVLTAVDPVPSLAGKTKTGGRLNLFRALQPNGNGMWAATGNTLNNARDQHTATLLSNGKVLVAGGLGTSGAILASAELYDPATAMWTPTSGSLTTGRYYQTATLLPSGKVLVAGGLGSSGSLASAELYDPATAMWTPTSRSLTFSRYLHTATLLPSGKVLVAGGYNSTYGYLPSAELYDPATGTWTTTGSLHTVRDSHTATLLNNGTVLVAGGYNGAYLASAEMYDPATAMWTATSGSLHTARAYHTATLLNNGQVLVAGGYNGAYLASAELYGPATGMWTLNVGMSSARAHHAASLLSNGKVLVAGGWGTSGDLPTAEVYDSATGSWTGTGWLTAARAGLTATLLGSGKVLAAGGYDGNLNPITSAELYNPIRF